MMRSMTRSGFIGGVSLVAVTVGCSGGGGGGTDEDVRVWFFTGPSGDARVEQTIHDDGSESLRGETVIELSADGVTLRAIESAELDPEGRLVSLDAHLWNTLGTTDIQKRVVVDVAAGQVRVTRPAGSVHWDVSSELPWIYFPSRSDFFFGYLTSSPVAGWIVARAALLDTEMFWPDHDSLTAFEIPEDITGNPVVYEFRFEEISADEDFITRMSVRNGAGNLNRTDVDPGVLLDFDVPEGASPVPFPDCTLPGTSETFMLLSSDGTAVYGQIDVPPGLLSTTATIVFNSGTRGTDRDFTYSSVPHWKCLAKPLLAAGFVVVRYDDRSHGMSQVGLETSTFQARSEDASVVAAWAAARVETDPGRLFLLGHSEGVLHASEAAVAVPDVDGLLLLAGLGTSGAVGLVEQIREIVEGYEMPAVFSANAIASQEEFIAEGCAGTLGPQGPGQLPAAFWQQICLKNGSDLAAAAARPTVIFQGTRDGTFLSSYDAMQIEAAVLGAGVTDVTRYEYPGLGHFFSPAPTTHPPMNDEVLLPFNWDAGLLAEIEAWIAAH